MKATWLLLAATTVAACTRGDDRNASADSAAGAVGSTAATAIPATPPAPVLTDANIVAIGILADSMEIVIAKLAPTKATSAEVKQFARMLVTDHSKDAREMLALAAAKSLTPQPPPNDTLATATHAAHQRFTEMPKGKAWDSAFVAMNITAHEKVIADVQNLQSQVQTPELRQHLDSLLPTLRKHLERAQAIQQKSDSTKM